MVGAESLNGLYHLFKKINTKLIVKLISVVEEMFSIILIYTFLHGLFFFT